MQEFSLIYSANIEISLKMSQIHQSFKLCKPLVEAGLQVI